MAAKLKTVIAEPCRVEGVEEPLKVGVSIGAASAPADGKTAATLTAKADKAMYLEKKGRGR